MILVWLAAGGVVLGLVLFGRGLLAYTRAQRVGGIASSPISAIAAGEVRVHGIVEPDAVLLVSPLQSERCVWYRARVDESAGRSSRTILDEARAVGFRVKDASGSIRVFPRGASFTAPDDLREGGGLDVDGTAGLRVNTGPAVIGVTEDDRDARIAELLTVRGGSAPGDPGSPGWGRAGGSRSPLGVPAGPRRYVEARIVPGDAVTVVGWAMPFAVLADPAGADTSASWDAVVPPDDPALLADLAEARAAGLLADSPEEAWGNAAIPGFGIGRPIRPPELDPGATPLPLGDAELAARVERRFEIADDELVLA
ncbi:MAG: hypothetical protein MUE82_08000, partial [Chloroflexi bacterium]|nr:hypothetical protein [Chloroflexota bacterium]